MPQYEEFDTRIPAIGAAKVDSPLQRLLMVNHEGKLRQSSFLEDEDRILVYDTPDYLCSLSAGAEPMTFELAGPRRKIYYDPTKIHCAIVTCGGLCPGTNDVIRAIVLELHHLYKVRHI